MQTRTLGDPNGAARATEAADGASYWTQAFRTVMGDHFSRAALRPS
jgi:hypothetical protein